MSAAELLDALLAQAERWVANGQGAVQVGLDPVAAPRQTVMLRLRASDGESWGSAYFDRGDRPGMFLATVEHSGEYEAALMAHALVDGAITRAIELARSGETGEGDRDTLDVVASEVAAWSPPPPLAAPTTQASLADALRRPRGVA